jgi:hypothetical protein
VTLDQYPDTASSTGGCSANHALPIYDDRFRCIVPIFSHGAPHPRSYGATTQLVNWFERDYKLDPNEAAVVLGTAMRYDIAEVVDPLVHIVAKFARMLWRS